MRTIRCWQLRARLTSYVDDEMPAEERLNIEGHLERCRTCRDRVSREQAVRQRLRRWSDELRRRGSLPSRQTVMEAHSPHHGRALLRTGAVITAVIAIVLVARADWRSGDTVAFAAYGHLTDSRCASGHTHDGPALTNVSGRDCVHRCVEMGARYVFVSQGVVYEIVNQGLADLTYWAGRDVQVEGNLRQNALTVSLVRPLAARRSDTGFHPGKGRNS